MTSTAKRVLVVDDEPSVRNFVVQVIASKGYAVASAEDGAEGVEKILGAPPDLVVLDMMMPVLDGYGVLARLDREGLRVPVIVLSAHVDPPRVRYLYDAVAAVITKPFRIQDLLAACERALAN